MFVTHSLPYSKQLMGLKPTDLENKTKKKHFLENMENSACYLVKSDSCVANH